MVTFGTCVIIFFARILDVSLGTIRMVLVIKEKRLFAMLVAFFEVSIWFLVAKEAISNIGNNIFVVISYAGGFSVGTFVGSTISSKVITGKLKVQVITKQNSEIIDKIKESGYGVSAIPTHDKKLMLILEVDKKKYPDLKKLLEKLDPQAFISVTETKFVENGFFIK